MTAPVYGLAPIVRECPDPNCEYVANSGLMLDRAAPLCERHATEVKKAAMADFSHRTACPDGREGNKSVPSGFRSDELLPLEAGGPISRDVPAHDGGNITPCPDGICCSAVVLAAWDMRHPYYRAHPSVHPCPSCGGSYGWSDIAHGEPCRDCAAGFTIMDEYHADGALPLPAMAGRRAKGHEGERDRASQVLEPLCASAPGPRKCRVRLRPGPHDGDAHGGPGTRFADRRAPHGWHKSRSQTTPAAQARADGVDGCEGGLPAGPDRAGLWPNGGQLRSWIEPEGRPATGGLCGSPFRVSTKGGWNMRGAPQSWLASVPPPGLRLPNSTRKPATGAKIPEVAGAISPMARAGGMRLSLLGSRVAGVIAGLVRPILGTARGAQRCREPGGAPIMIMEVRQ